MTLSQIVQLVSIAPICASLKDDFVDRQKAL